MSKSEEGQLMVEMHNNLVRHTMERMTHLSVIDQRVIGYLVAIGIKNPKNKEMPRRVIGSVTELANICGITTCGDIYKGIRKATESLMRQVIRFKHPETGKNVSTTWLAEGVYSEGEGTFEVQFSDSMQRLLTELSKYRTIIELETMLGLGSSNYAIRLYQIAKSYQSLNYWITSIEEFRQQMGVPNGTYTRIHDFKQKVLEYPLKAINKKSDIEIIYEKHNKGRKWTHLAFEVKPKEKMKLAISANETPQCFENLTHTEQGEYWQWLRVNTSNVILPEHPNWQLITPRHKENGITHWLNDKQQSILPGLDLKKIQA